MTVGILDTTVIVHLFRRHQAALNWLRTHPMTLSITSITWLEFMVGVANKRAQEDSLKLLNGFELIYLTPTDQAWAMQQLHYFRFSHGIGMNDYLIASVAERLQVPLYTHNLKHMTLLVGSKLAVQPYT